MTARRGGSGRDAMDTQGAKAAARELKAALGQPNATLVLAAASRERRG